MKGRKSQKILDLSGSIYPDGGAYGGVDIVSPYPDGRCH